MSRVRCGYQIVGASSSHVGVVAEVIFLEDEQKIVRQFCNGCGEEVVDDKPASQAPQQTRARRYMPFVPAI